MNNHTQVSVDRLPKCDMCKNRNAKYDAKTHMGPWAYLCKQCYALYGIGLGLGKGQELILREKP